MTGGAQLVNLRSPLPRRRRHSSLMRLILIVSQSLGFLARNAILNPERVNHRRLVAIAEPSAIVSSARRQGTPSVGKSFAPVIIEIIFILP